jgi:hypothetical protein
LFRRAPWAWPFDQSPQWDAALYAAGVPSGRVLQQQAFERGIRLMQRCLKGRLIKNKAKAGLALACSKTGLPILSPLPKYVDKTSGQANMPA